MWSTGLGEVGAEADRKGKQRLGGNRERRLREGQAGSRVGKGSGTSRGDSRLTSLHNLPSHYLPPCNSGRD